MSTTDTTEPFVSSLPTGPQRFLAEALEHALANGRRTPADFIRHFPPMAMMEALDEVPELRASFLTVLVGLREKTALRTPSSDAGRLLQAALEEGDCDAEAIVSLFAPDHRIKYLDGRKVWLFLMEGEPWKISRSKDAAGFKKVQQHMAYLIDRGIVHGLHSHQDVVDGITVEVLAEKLPRSELAKLVKRALSMGRENRSFTDRDMAAAVPTAVVLDHVPLPQVMESVITPMARRANYLEPPPAKEEKREATNGGESSFPSFDISTPPGSQVPPPDELS
ncbi:MAG TPA: hypothetical protein VHB21_00755 [Minicystis sp.]|nr:hypothetical protein [Minicystis sp.]